MRGRITECGIGTSAYRVVAFEETRVRFEDVKGTVTSTKRLGDAFPNADGRYAIPFDPTVFPDGVEDATVTAYVKVFLGGTMVWQSPKRVIPESGLLAIDHELYPDCPPGSARVRVVDDTGRRVPGAEIFVNGETAGVTDVAGQAFVRVDQGDRLVARKLLHEQGTPRNYHGRDSYRNWSYRVYVTSLTVEHDQNGDDVTTGAYVVDDPAATHDLQVRRRNTLVGFNLRCSLEWDAGADMLRYEEALAETSELLYNGMDGQFLIEQIEISDDGTYWDEADIRVYAKRNRRGTGNLGGLWGDDGYIRMNPYDGQWPEVLFHELGHYALDLRDEYTEGTTTTTAISAAPSGARRRAPPSATACPRTRVS